MSQKDLSEKALSAEGSQDEIQEEEKAVPAYIPKNPIIRPADVKISKIMAELMGSDKVQVNLHRTLGACADIDNQHTLDNHLQKVFDVLVDSYPDCALEKLEEVSYLIRKGHDLSQFLNVCIDREYRQQAQDLKDYIEKTQPLFKKPAAEEEGEDPPETPPVCAIQDLVAEARIFAWAGISFGQQESYLLQKSLQKLAQEQNCSFLKFFGKVRCTQQDYYIVEATAEGGEEAAEQSGAEAAEEEKDPDMEDKGTGVNKYTYFVSSGAFTAWKRLPDLTPKLISAARDIKVLFSGDLERDIICNPFFFGKEKHFLRAQIARIAHSTQIVPAGTYKLNEENDREIDQFEPEEDSKVDPLPSTTQAADLNRWVHFNASILNCCRTAHLDPPEEAPENFEGEYDIEEEKKLIEQADPFEVRLKNITTDRKIKMGGKMMQSPWVCRLEGDRTECADEQGKTVCHGVVVIRSLVWPGAFTLYQNGKQTSIYVGDGSKFSEAMRPFPLSPPILNMDPSEYGEFVLPEVKVLSPEEIRAEISKHYDELWSKYDEESTGLIAGDDVKKLAADVKAKLAGTEEAEVNEEAFDKEWSEVEKDDDGKVTKDACKDFLVGAHNSL